MTAKITAAVTININDGALMARLNDAVFAATEEVFADIQATAAENSPVLAKATSERYPDENRDSIQTSVEQVDAGVEAQLFTTSGYGGYLELGTSKTAAQPYLWPAVEEHIDKLPEAVKAKLDSLGP